MHDHNWVTLLPKNPDRNIIAAQFFKTGKKGAQTFRAGKCVINLHIPHEIYEGMLTQKSELEVENETADVSLISSAEFTIGFPNKTIFCRLKDLISWLKLRGRSACEVYHLI